MKNMKFLSWIMAIVITLSILPLATFTASAASYDSNAAINYAAAHWNDGIGACASFVSRCLNAGGCSASSSGVGTLRGALLDGGWGTEYELKRYASNYYAIKVSDNIGKLSYGDPIFYYCKKCDKPWAHVVICSGFNSSGYAKVYAHNAAKNDEVIYNYQDEYGHTGSDMIAYSIHMQSHTHSYGDWQTVSAATCTTAGSKKRVCSCGDTQTESIPATGHKWDDGLIVTEAGCTNAGVKKYTCTKCSTTKTEALNATGHTPVSDNAVAATCIKTGLTEGSHCEKCGAIIVAQQVISALGHDNHVESIISKCNNVSAIYTCGRCGEKTHLADQDYIYSDWSEEKPAGLSEELIEEKSQTRYRNKNTKYNDGSSTLDGWIWSGDSETIYGSWSNVGWTSSKPNETEVLRITDTKTVTDKSSYTEYTYYYYRYYNSSVGRYYYTYSSGMGGTKYTKTLTSEMAYYDTYSGHAGYTKSGGGYYNFSNELWFLESTQTVPAVTHTEWYYQTRSKITRYYFYNWSDWSDWSDEIIESTNMRDVQSRTVYRYKVVPTGHTEGNWIIDREAQIGATGSKHTECTVCHTVLKTETIPALEVIDENAPRIVVESKKASAGKTVEVKLMLKNNPGVASLKLKVAYDNDLTLIGIVYNSEIGGNAQEPQTLESPVVLNWFNGAENSNSDFVFATLTFKVSDNAEAGAKSISVTYNQEDVYNITENNIGFSVVNGNIDVTEYTPGDINGDGNVNNKDLTRLFQYLSEWDVEVNAAALDVNGDGNTNNKDLTRLFQYLSEWDVEIF